MKIAVKILKVLEIIMTAIWGIVFGILTPLAVMTGGIAADEIAGHYILKVWIINSLVCYFVGTLILMLGFYKTALCFHTVGLIVALVIYGTFSGIYNGINTENPSVLYMPVIFITFLTLAITVIVNFKKINESLSTVKEKKYKPSPSVLGGEYTIKENEKNKKSGKNKKGGK